MTVPQNNLQFTSNHLTNINGSQSIVPEKSAPSGISVLVIGAGVAGLMASLECWRKGHEVRVIEKSATRILSGKSNAINVRVANPIILTKIQETASQSDQLPSVPFNNGQTWQRRTRE